MSVAFPAWSYIKKKLLSIPLFSVDGRLYKRRKRLERGRWPRLDIFIWIDNHPIKLNGCKAHILILFLPFYNHFFAPTHASLILLPYFRYWHYSIIQPQSSESYWPFLHHILPHGHWKSHKERSKSTGLKICLKRGPWLALSEVMWLLISGSRVQAPRWV